VRERGIFIGDTKTTKDLLLRTPWDWILRRDQWLES
jgi:hypothetical protein